MKTIGLLGGMSWESTLPYYRIINEQINARLGGLHSAELLLYSVDFEPIERLQHDGAWDRLGVIMADAAARLEQAGAALLVICTNTMHKLVPAIEQRIDMPIVHIADATAESVRQHGIESVGLLGTRFTMEEDFYRGRLAGGGLRVLTPEAADREIVHRVIYDELCRGVVRDDSRHAFHRIVDRLIERGAAGVILGCTEIFMVVDAEGIAVPVFDTTSLHARRAAELALV